MNYEQILRQIPVFNAVIENLQSIEAKIAFADSLKMLDYLYATTVPGDDLWLAILHHHAPKLSSSLLEKLGNNDEWIYISGSGIKDSTGFPFDEIFLREYIDEIDWNILCENYVIPEPIIREYDDWVNWSMISFQDLTDDFVNEFSSRLDWDVISSKRRLSENFIRRFELELNWDLVSGMQRLSESFILEFSHKINFYQLLISPHRPRTSFFADLLTRAYHD